jgi:hypothetical protein
MTREDRGHYAEKHPSDRKIRPEIAEGVKARTSDGEISCASAFEVAAEQNISPSEVGLSLDLLEIPIVKCQLGLFGYRPKKRVVKPARNVSEKMETAIRTALVGGRLPCASAWEIADRFRVGRMEVSSACETLKIKVSDCQLGAF